MTRVQHIIRLVSVVGAGVVIGCAAPPKKTVTFSTAPEGAVVLVNGQERGKAPLTTTLDFSNTKSYDVVAKLPEYEDAKTVVGLDPKTKTDYPLALAKKQRIVVKTVQIEPTPTDTGLQLKPVEKESVAYLETIERSAFVPGVTQITFNTNPSAFVGAPVLSPVSDTMVYTVSLSKGTADTATSIWKQNVSSAAKTRMTLGRWQDLDPAFSPDGKYLVFSSNRSGSHSTLWRMNAEGAGGITKVTSSDTTDYDPCVCGAGDLIAYASLPPSPNAPPQIWMVRPDGSFPTQLREGESPHFSPDGKQLLFIRPSLDVNKARGKRTGQLWLMNIDGSGETLLTSDVNGDVKDPKWSPDGHWILFACDEGRDSAGANNYDIWIMAADGTQRKQLTTNGSADDSPCMDRNQEFVYFRSNRGGQFNIWRFPTQYLGINRLGPATLPVAGQ